MINDPSDVLSTVPVPPSVRAEVNHLRRKIAEQDMEIRYWRDECARIACERDTLRMCHDSRKLAP